MSDFESLSGIPVMDGLTEDLSQRVVFDKTEGRIIRALLIGDVTPEGAAAFYKEALFQLGWVAQDGGQGMQFVRDDEVLTLSVSGDGPIEISVSLQPLS